MNNNKLSYFEAKDWIRDNVAKDAFSYIVKQKDFPIISETIKKKVKRMSKTEENNNISLEILRNINDLKKMREGKAEDKTQQENGDDDKIMEARANSRNKKKAIDGGSSEEERSNTSSKKKQKTIK